MKRLIAEVFAIVLGSILVAVLLTAVMKAASAGTERVDLNDRVEVDVLSTDVLGGHVRKGLVHKFSDARFIVCIEYKDKVVLDCLVADAEGSVIAVPVRLIEEKI